VTVQSRGLISHIKKCEREEREKREDEEIERIIHREAQNKQHRKARKRLKQRGAGEPSTSPSIVLDPIAMWSTQNDLVTPVRGDLDDIEMHGSSTRTSDQSVNFGPQVAPPDSQDNACWR